MRNGFFQLVHKEDGTYIRLIPPKDGGKPIPVHELMEYLEKREIAYNVKELNEGLADTSSEKLVRLNDVSMPPFKESYSLYVSSNKMEAAITFYAPSLDGEEMTEVELMDELSARRIKYGICLDNVKGFFENRVYCQDIPIAQGDAYEPGRPASIEYMFPTQRKAKPSLREDGSVDFHKLNTIYPCKEGEVLAKLTPAVQGKRGRNIYGDALIPPVAKEEKLRFGKNIELSEDGLSISSTVNGHVTLINGEVFVSNLLQLENVDVSTGDIDFEGSILINGNVFSGYHVKAGGDIEIRGVVEGATVESGGNISIARGMNGMSKGKLSAKGHIVSKFLENAEVSAGEYVSTEAILHSKVSAGTEIQVTGKKGFITGGKVMASNKIEVKTLGSSMGASTIVEVGINPELKKRQIELMQSAQEIKKYLASIEPVLLAVLQKKQKDIAISDKQMQNVRQLAVSRNEKKEELSRIDKELDELDEILVEGKEPAVEVSGEVYPGTKICILDVSMIVKSVAKYCRFIRSEGEVKMAPLS